MHSTGTLTMSASQSCYSLAVSMLSVVVGGGWACTIKSTTSWLSAAMVEEVASYQDVQPPRRVWHPRHAASSCSSGAAGAADTRATIVARSSVLGTIRLTWATL